MIGAPPPGTPAAGVAEIRPAHVGDVWAIRDLLTLRDGRPWDDGSTAWFMCALDPARCLAWIAFDGPRPAAFTNMFLRELAGPTGTLRAGYWANLFVDPDYRGQLLYPRLPFAMLAEAKRLKLDLIYSANRLRNVSLAHTGLGFRQIGQWRVLMKLLRPARLVGKHRGWGPVTALSAPIDGTYGVVRRALQPRAPAGLEVEEVDVGCADLTPLVLMMRSAAGDRVAEAWTPEQLRYRYRQTREGGRYVLLAVRRGGTLVGMLAYRVAERGLGILAGIVMDAVCMPGEEAVLAAALARAESHLDRQGCELVLFLDGLGTAVKQRLRKQGYHDSPECYDLLIWPKGGLAANPALGGLDAWRFGFVDHDAF